MKEYVLYIRDNGRTYRMRIGLWQVARAGDAIIIGSRFALITLMSGNTCAAYFTHDLAW